MKDFMTEAAQQVRDEFQRLPTPSKDIRSKAGRPITLRAVSRGVWLNDTPTAQKLKAATPDGARFNDIINGVAVLCEREESTLISHAATYELGQMEAEMDLPVSAACDIEAAPSPLGPIKQHGMDEVVLEYFEDGFKGAGLEFSGADDLRFAKHVFLDGSCFKSAVEELSRSGWAFVRCFSGASGKVQDVIKVAAHKDVDDPAITDVERFRRKGNFHADRSHEWEWEVGPRKEVGNEKTGGVDDFGRRVSEPGQDARHSAALRGWRPAPPPAGRRQPRGDMPAFAEAELSVKAILSSLELEHEREVSALWGEIAQLRQETAVLRPSGLSDPSAQQPDASPRYEDDRPQREVSFEVQRCPTAESPVVVRTGAINSGCNLLTPRRAVVVEGGSVQAEPSTLAAYPNPSASSSLPLDAAVDDGLETGIVSDKALTPHSRNTSRRLPTHTSTISYNTCRSRSTKLGGHLVSHVKTIRSRGYPEVAKKLTMALNSVTDLNDPDQSEKRCCASQIEAVSLALPPCMSPFLFL
ncbi:unnamed protein product [Prorocentrum cordatum]|uniref:Uncharacterized protein n=1 Tax=Prorocentrum cordatum TaxID=2364126 RepID=A0ABN9RAW3_9DINO|nr:unnamed protein product [Polarella glacialis]